MDTEDTTPSLAEAPPSSPSRKGRKKMVVTLARLIPNSIEIKDGERSIIIASNLEENRVLNYYTIGQIRDVLTHSIEDFRNKEATLTPKELRDLAEAGRALADYSDTVYAKGEAPRPIERTVEPAASDIPDFGRIGEVKS